jgi:DNA-binding beta-propeller fold protein YncE
MTIAAPSSAIVRIAASAAALLIAAVALLRAAPPPVSAGNGTIVVGTFPKQYYVIDEATEKVVGTIPFTSGMPRRTSLSRDRTRFYAIEAGMEKVEIIDVARRSTIDTFTLTDGNKKVRIRSMEPDPLHRFVMLLTTSVTKLPDRFEIGAPALVQYDLAQKKITRTIPWPNGDERQNVQIQFSPDGRLMYMFSDQDVLIYDTSSFTQVDKWELSKPIEEGFGRLEFGSSDAINDEPGYYTAIFNVSDPVHNRRTMGIGRVNLAAKTVDFYTIGPSTPVGFTMAPGRKVAYGLFSEIGRYEFWKFDLVNRKLAGRTEFKGRPRMSLKTSSNGKVLYIYNAGNTIDLWDAETYQYLRTITLDGDMTSEMFVLPGSAPPSSTTSQ